MSSPVSYDLQGQNGSIVLSSAATTYTGNIRWIQVVNDAVFDQYATDPLETKINPFEPAVPFA